MITVAVIAMVVCIFGFLAGSPRIFYSSIAVIASMLCVRLLP